MHSVPKIKEGALRAYSIYRINKKNISVQMLHCRDTVFLIRALSLIRDKGRLRTFINPLQATTIYLIQSTNRDSRTHREEALRRN